MALRTGRPDLIRDLNRSLVLNLVRERGPLSRADVARLSGLSPSTVTAITADLVAERFLLEGDYLPRAAGVLGRPAVRLRVNPDAGVVIGIKLAADTVTLALSDLGGQALALNSHDHPGRASVEETIGFLARAIDELTTTIPHGTPLLGVGLGVPGIVDPRTQRVSHSPFLGWGEQDVAASLERRVGVPVHIDNDVNTLTIAEQLFGPGRGVSTFAVVTIGRGIGMGAVINGVLHRGARGGAGELGHISVEQAAGRKCWCGRDGCLEALAAEPALVREVAARTGRVIRPEDLDAAARSDGDVAEVLRRAGAEVGRAVANVAMTLDPELVVVAGEGVRLGSIFLSSLREGIARAARPGGRELEVVIEPWGDEAWARGAASLVLRELFHPAHLRPDAGSAEPGPAVQGAEAAAALSKRR